MIGYTSLFDFYEIKETLGQGAYGVVALGLNKLTGEEVAIKQIKKKNMSA